MTAKRFRPAVRGLVVDPAGHVLMVRLSFPHGAYWVLPGGGVDTGETEMDALHRELREETGLESAEVAGHVWNRVHEFDLVEPDGTVWDGQSESVHLVRTRHFLPRPSFTPEQLRAENLDEHRWWTLDEIDAYDGPDRFAPRDIGVHLRTVLENGPPVVPFVIHEVN